METIKNNTTIQVQSEFTPYTVDTYGTFTGDMADEMILEDLSEQHGKVIDWNDVEIECDNKKVVEEIGDILAKYLFDNYEHIKDAKVSKVNMPRFYNYETDSVTIDLESDMPMIEQYCTDNIEAYGEFLQGEASNYLRVSAEEKQVIFYIKHASSDEMVNDYQNEVYERLNEIYYNNTSYTIK